MVRKNKMELGEKIFLGILVGVVIATIMFTFTLFGRDAVDIALDQETGDDICRQLTGNSTAVASVEFKKIYDGKLICTIPSYDSTQNIIVKSNDE